MAIIGMITQFVMKVDSLTKTVFEQSNEMLVMTTSINNLTADNDAISSALLSEQLLRQSLQESIKTNSKLIEGYSNKLSELNQETSKKKLAVIKIAEESPDENCINTTMPNSIISMFDYETNTASSSNSTSY